jgi:hypothetical protein
MSTTYAKIRATLAEVSKKSSWEFHELKAAVVSRDKSRTEENFLTKQTATKRKKPVSDESFDRLLRLMVELDLLRKDKTDDFYMPDAVKDSLDDDERYRLMLSRRITEYLDKCQVTIAQIRQATQLIQYPNVRDPATILETIKKTSSTVEINVGKFTQILFLFACAGKRAQRHMRIFYEFK